MVNQYKITQSEDGTVTRDGTVTEGAVGPLVWRMTVNGVQKLQRNAMSELSFKYQALSSYPGQQFQTWLEMQERAADGTSKDVCVSNVVTHVYKAPVALNPKKWVAFPLESRIDINHNTRRLRFKLPVEDLGLPVGMHIFLKGKIDGAPVMRAYTPVGCGPFYVEFIIKVYFPLPPKFPDGGKLTQHMETLKVGDTLDFKGPLGEFDFDCSGVSLPRDTLSTFKKEGKPGGSFKHLGLIAGGSGITPLPAGGRGAAAAGPRLHHQPVVRQPDARGHSVPGGARRHRQGPASKGLVHGRPRARRLEVLDRLHQRGHAPRALARRVGAHVRLHVRPAADAEVCVPAQPRQARPRGGARACLLKRAPVRASTCV